MLNYLMVLLMLSITVTVSSYAKEPGTPIFSDNFDTAAMFAERWAPKDKRIKAEDGKIVFPTGGALSMKGATPREFYVEMDITVDMSHQPDLTKWGQAFCGFMIEGFRFMVLPSGITWMIYKLNGYEKAHGKHVAIDGFEQRKPIRLTLIRKVDNDVATYLYRVNGKDAGSFVYEAPAALPNSNGEPDRFNPLEIFSYNVNMTLDNFSMSTLKRSAEDSPNVIYNSSFEHEQDGFPLYFGRSGFNMAKATTISYEDFLATWSLDTEQKHSGRQSLKVVFNESVSGQTLWAWGAGTVKDLPGVFSVWLKADQEDFPVSISYGKRQEVKVGTAWKRYEVVNPKLPGAGVYSPVTISFNKIHGTLWVDDLQAEFLGPLDEEKLTAGDAFATPYKPSELDKQKFGKHEPSAYASGMMSKQLPDSLIPNSAPDTWKNQKTEAVIPPLIDITEGIYSDDGDAMVVSLAIKNLAGRDLHLHAELFDAQNHAEILAKKDFTLKQGGSDITFLSQTKTNKIRLKLTDGDILITDEIVHLEKRAPVSIIGRLNYYMNETEAVFRVNANLVDVDKMTAVLTVADQTVRMPTSTGFKFAVPLNNIKNGTHTVALALMKDSRNLAEVSSELVKRPYKEGATQINHFTRSLIHEGKPIFHIAPFFDFSKHQSKEYVLATIDWADRYGFRFFHILVDNRAEDRAVWAISYAQEKGIKVMLWTKYNELTDEEGDALRTKLDFPNIISQMVLDEPELSTPSDVARAFLRKMHSKYPYHPVQMNNSVLGIPNRYADLETDILMLDDYLTNVENRDVASVVDGSDIMWKAGKDKAKPCFYFLAGGNFPLHHREPSYAEQIAQAYGNIAAGCTGLSYFYGAPATPGNWKALIQLNKEILFLNDILLSEEECTQSASSANPKTLRHLTRKHKGYLYVIACNIGKSPTDTTFTLPAEFAYTDGVEVMFEDRGIPMVKGTVTDAFSGYSRHVYKVKLR